MLAAGAVSAEPEQAALIAAASASPVAAEAWCTVTDRLRRLRADLEVLTPPLVNTNTLPVL